MLDAIHADVLHATDALAAQNTDYGRRAFVRSVFTAIEGTLYILRSDIIADIESGQYRPPLAEEVILREESYYLDTNKLSGVSSPRYTPVDVMLRFTLRSLASAHNVGYEMDTSTDGWRAFRVAIKVRNRITHPKDPDEFMVTDSELKDSIKAYDWFYAEYRHVHTHINTVLQKRIDACETELERRKKIEQGFAGHPLQGVGSPER